MISLRLKEIIITLFLISFSFLLINTASAVQYVDTCGDINESTILNGSIYNHNGDCFNIIADNIIFDCNNYKIQGDNDLIGRGIIFYNRNNVTIKKSVIALLTATHQYSTYGGAEWNHWHKNI